MLGKNESLQSYIYFFIQVVGGEKKDLTRPSSVGSLRMVSSYRDEIGCMKVHSLKELLYKAYPFNKLHEKLIAQADNQATTDIGSSQSFRKDSNRRIEESDRETHGWYEKNIHMNTSQDKIYQKYPNTELWKSGIKNPSLWENLPGPTRWNIVAFTRAATTAPMITSSWRMPSRVW